MLSLNPRIHIQALIDGASLLLSSANLTGAALERNMALGIVVHGGDLPPTAKILIDGLIAVGELTRV